MRLVSECVWPAFAFCSLRVLPAHSSCSCPITTEQAFWEGGFKEVVAQMATQCAPRCCTKRAEVDQCVFLLFKVLQMFQNRPLNKDNAMEICVIYPFDLTPVLSKCTTPQLEFYFCEIAKT